MQNPHPAEKTFFMKKFAFTAILVFVSSLLFAQSQVSGRVADQNDRQPLPFASVAVTEISSGQLVTGVVTDAKGSFVIEGLAAGEYQVAVSFVGYDGFSEKILVGSLNNTLNLGTILLQSADRSLDAVSVTARREQVSASLDRKSYTIDDNVSQLGGSALDAMKNMPGVTTTQEGKVMLRGSDKVVVLIDGKQSGITGLGAQKGLENIPAAAIESIEIINNPSAKYDAAGMAGIINIIYKKESREGLNGDVGFDYGLGMMTKRKADLPTGLPAYSWNSKYIPSLNLNYRKGAVNAFLQTSLIAQNSLPNNEFTLRTYDAANGGGSYLSQVAENRVQRHFNIKAGLDWQIGKHDYLTLFGVYDYEHHIDTSKVGYFDLATWQPRNSYSFGEDEGTGYVNATAIHKHNFDQPGHDLTTSLQFTKGWEDERYDVHFKSTERDASDMTHIIAPEYTWLLNSDYRLPLAFGRLEAGVKGQIRTMPTDYTAVWGPGAVVYPGVGDWSDWRENIASVYGNLIVERRKFDVEAGLRLEQTWIGYKISENNTYYTNKNDKYDYFRAFPNVRFTWKINQGNRLSLFYNYRVDRPSENELRIFPKSDDPENLKVGNPYLRPQFTQGVEAAYKYLWKGGSLFAAVYYKHIEEPFMRIYAVDTVAREQLGLLIMDKIYQNLGREQNLGAELLFDQQIAKNWKLSASFNIYRKRIDAFDGVIYFPYERTFHTAANSSTPWFAKINTSFVTLFKTQFQISGAYYSAKNAPQGRELSRWGVDAGAKRSFLGGKLEANVSATDIFATMRIRQELSGEGFTAVYGNYYESQVVRIGVKYKF